jgi:UDP-N-acetylglucosamine--N-acetylmuramyl-(pentapeptide) pyrophosphoryl-undecaprenol N-acetylglucosamine transferase
MPLRSPAGSPTPLTVVLAGGGSGGHIYPGLAIAERLFERRPGARAIFLCSGRRVDREILDAAAAEYHAIDAAPLALRPRGLLRFARGYLGSRRRLVPMLRREGVGHVLALGGFVAAPVVAAARAASIPITLLNLDVPPGKANRWMRRRCDRVLSAVALPGAPGFADRVVGMPVRRRAICRDTPAACRAQLGLDPGRRTLLVLGGSQGAGSVNAFLGALVGHDADRFRGWQIHHVSGPADQLGVSTRYLEAGVPAQVPSFCARMDLAWGAADLAVSRAGASSVAEAAINGVPCLFMPYPHHRDQHQRFNAEPLAELGGAMIVEDLVEAGANRAANGPRLFALMDDAPRREAMRAALRAHPTTDAAAAIADLIAETNGAGRR